jgi:membrane-bound metal-dependent hydrolase YbcI (DUF457 family)
MPSPIGHAIGGLIVGVASTGGQHGTRPAGARRLTTWPILACVAAACLPDLDFLWGRHNMETHSIGFAAIVGLAIWAITRSTRLALACAASVGTHVLFDWLGSDDSPPLGVMALWPLSDAFFFADAFVFEAISRRYWLPGFVQHNLLALAREVALLLPLTAAVWWWRSRTRSA